MEFFHVTFPLKVVQCILQHVDNKNDLVQMSLVSRVWRQEAIAHLFKRLILSKQSTEKLQSMTQAVVNNGYGRYVKEVVLDISMLQQFGYRSAHRPCCALLAQKKTEKSHTTLQRHASAPHRHRLLSKWRDILPRRYNSICISEEQNPRTYFSDAAIPPRPQHIPFDDSTPCPDCTCLDSSSQSVVSILQACQGIRTLEIDFKGIPFNMSHNVNYLFTCLLTTTRFRSLESLTLRGLTRLGANPDLNPIWMWMASLELRQCHIAWCHASFFSRRLAWLMKSRSAGTLVSVTISSLIMWDPVQQIDIDPDFSWVPISVTHLSILDSPEWLHQKNALADLTKQLPNLSALHLSIGPQASSTAAFFVLTHDSAYQSNTPCALEIGLAQALQHCHALRHLTVDGFPTLTDHVFYAILGHDDQSPPVPDLTHLRLSHNKGLTGSRAVRRRLIQAKQSLAHASIDLTGCSRLNPDFVRCVEWMAGAALVKW